MPVQVLFKVFSGHKPEVPADMPADYKSLMEECWGQSLASDQLSRLYRPACKPS